MKRAPVLIPVLIVAILVGSIILAGCSSTTTTSAPAATTSAAPAPTTSGPVITFKYGYDTPPTTGLGVPAEYFAKEINSRLAGRVQVQTYPAGSLASMGTSVDNLRHGVADIYVISFGAQLENFPLMNFTSLPGLNFYPDTAKDIKAETDTMHAIIDKFAGPKTELKGLRLLWGDTYSTAVYMGKKQIKTPADMVNVKVGCDGMRQEVVKTIGGVPVFTIPPQMYQQLQTNVVTGVLAAWGAALDWQLQEQVQYVLDFSFGGSQLAVLMNEDSYNKMSAADKKIFDAVCVAAEGVNRDFVDKQIIEARDKFAKAGVQIYKPTDAEKAAWMDKYKVVWQAYLDRNKDYPDAQAIFDYWKKAVETPR
jgi:TRAP-type C4-dicarboxylate transport system substrate-binding protein